MLEHLAQCLDILACGANQGLRADGDPPKLGGTGRENVVTYATVMHTFGNRFFFEIFKKL